MSRESLPDRPAAPLTPELPENPSANGDAPLGTLFRQLADDGRLLIQQEIALAKVEVQTNVLSFAKRTALVAAGIALLVAGLLVLMAFLVIALGGLLGDRYWLSALIIGAVLAIAGLSAMLVGRSGLSRQTLAPGETVASIRESAGWARDEAHRLRHDLTRTNGSK